VTFSLGSSKVPSVAFIAENPHSTLATADTTVPAAVDTWAVRVTGLPTATGFGVASRLETAI